MPVIATIMAKPRTGRVKAVGLRAPGKFSDVSLPMIEWIFRRRFRRSSPREGLDAARGSDNSQAPCFLRRRFPEEKRQLRNNVAESHSDT